MTQHDSLDSVVRWWMGAVVTFVALAALFNAWVDPYLVFDTPRAARFNALKPSVLSHEGLAKSFEALRAQPNSLVLGASPADWALDPRNPAWPASARPVYNLALVGHPPYFAYRYLQHVMAQRRIDLVVLSLDFILFFDPDTDMSEPQTEQRLAVTRDGAHNTLQWRQELYDSLEATLSLEALTDSIATVYANLVGLGTEPGMRPFENANFRRWATAIGASRMLAWSDHWEVLTDLQSPASYDHQVESVRAILELCKSKGTKVIVFIDPMHADRLEIIDLAGRWPIFENWKRALAGLATRYSDSGQPGQVTLWDFSGYDEHTTEAPPQSPGRMRWFWDNLHYTAELGDLITQRIFGASSVAFGVPLTIQDVESHLEEIRQKRHQYREDHPQAAQRVRAIYSSVLQGSRAPPVW